jgi:hypothetical protein
VLRFFVASLSPCCYIVVTLVFPCCDSPRRRSTGARRRSGWRPNGGAWATVTPERRERTEKREREREERKERKEREKERRENRGERKEEAERKEREKREREAREERENREREERERSGWRPSGGRLGDGNNSVTEV